MITRVSLGESAKIQITRKITEIVSDLIIVSPGRDSADSINNDTADLVKEASDYIQTIAPTVRGTKIVEAGGQSLKTSVVGCACEYAVVGNYQVEYR